MLRGGICPEPAPSNGTIWDKFSEQHQQQSTIFDAQFSPFWCKLGANSMRILVGMYLYKGKQELMI